MLNTFSMWCVNNNAKFVLYILWLLLLPCFFFVYLKQAGEDALEELDYIKNKQKDSK